MSYPLVHITKPMVQQARATSKKIRNLKNSIRAGEGAYIARLGELAVAEYVEGTIADTYHYDVLSPKGKTLEVKSVETTVTPEPHFRVHVCAWNSTQSCDYYVFTRVHLKAGVYLVGYMAAEDFREWATFRSKGEIEPDTGWVVKEDSYSMKIEDLKRFPRRSR